VSQGAAHELSQLSTIVHRMTPPTFDLVGVGLNATDTLIKVAHFPAYGGKVPIGGQVASALAAIAGGCRG
jgi:hypothetical protein